MHMSDTDLKWCCEGIRYRFECRTERGFFVFAEPPNRISGERPSFWIGVNAIDEAQSQYLPDKIGGESIVYLIKTWLPIRYCPWCGKKLERFYRNRWRQLFDEAVSADHNWQKPD
ncbi:MAG: hypothetical protein GC159_21480 [Phycisphaera sp.]|nr:hypothetical protein [Phycisphaera sp.]